MPQLAGLTGSPFVALHGQENCVQIESFILIFLVWSRLLLTSITMVTFYKYIIGEGQSSIALTLFSRLQVRNRVQMLTKQSQCDRLGLSLRSRRQRMSNEKRIYN